MNFGIYKSWFLMKVFPIMILGLLFFILGLCWDWVSYHNPGKIYGRLIQMPNYDDLKKLDYSCIAGPNCDVSPSYSDNERKCNAFGKLHDASVNYLSFFVIASAFWCIWIEHLIYLSLRSDFGFLIMNYFWPVIPILLLFSGTISWISISGASFGGTCKVKAGDEDINFCSEKGVSFTILGVLCLTFSGLLYIAIFFQRENSPNLKISPLAGRKKSKVILGKTPIMDKSLDDLNPENTAADIIDIEDQKRLNRLNTMETLGSEEYAKKNTFRDRNFAEQG